LITYDDRLTFINQRDAKVFNRQVVPDTQTKNKDSGLPIILHEREIMEQIENFVVTLVCGETGSGKSTQLPQFIL